MKQLILMINSKYFSKHRFPQASQKKKDTEKKKRFSRKPTDPLFEELPLEN